MVDYGIGSFAFTPITLEIVSVVSGKDLMVGDSVEANQLGGLVGCQEFSAPRTIQDEGGLALYWLQRSSNLDGGFEVAEALLVDDGGRLTEQDRVASNRSLTQLDGLTIDEAIKALATAQSPATASTASG